jgi:hypothetical protein
MSTLPLIVCNPLLVNPALFFWLIKIIVAPVRSLMPLNPVISLPSLSEGETLGVTGTPSTFVVKNDNGKLIILENINGALPKETVDSIIKKYSE